MAPCPDALPITELNYLFVLPSVELWASENKSICILMKHFMFLFGSGLWDVSNGINKYVAHTKEDNRTELLPLRSFFRSVVLFAK